MTEPTTIRECLESIQALGESGKLSHSTLIAVEMKAQAALDLLDNYPHVNYGPLSQPPEHYKIIPDPAPRGDTHD